jgi:hypothetical protein
MSNFCRPGNEIAFGALATSTICSAAMPCFWPLTGEMFKLQCNPGDIYEAGERWLAAADEIMQAMQESVELGADTISGWWEGDAALAYLGKASQYTAQLLADYLLAITVGIALMVSAVILFGLIIMIAAIAVVEVGFLTAYLAALAGIITAVGAPAILAAATTLTGTVLMPILSAATSIAATAMTTFGVAIGALVVGNAGAQLLTGNTEAVDNLAQATVDTAQISAAGFASLALRNLLAKGMSGGGNLGLLSGGLGLGGTILGDNQIRPDGLGDASPGDALYDIPGTRLPDRHTDGVAGN